jgi:hypothetical protein
MIEEDLGRALKMAGGRRIRNRTASAAEFNKEQHIQVAETLTPRDG